MAGGNLPPGSARPVGGRSLRSLPEEALAETEPVPEAVVLVLLGAEEDDEPVLAQLTALQAQRS